MAGNLFNEMTSPEVEPEREAESQPEPKDKSHVVWENILSNGLPWVRVICPVMHYTEQKYTVSEKTVFTHCGVTERIPADVLEKYQAQRAALKAGRRPNERWTVWFA